MCSLVKLSSSALKHFLFNLKKTRKGSNEILSCWFSLNWLLVCSCQVVMDGAVTSCQSVDYFPDQSLSGVTSREGHVSANRRGPPLGFLTCLLESCFHSGACLFCFLML